MCKRIIYGQKLLTQETSIEVATNGFEILYVDEKDGYPTVWYETIPDSITKTKINFYYAWTGFNVPDNSRHVGSCKCDSIVYHVYQIFK